MRGMSSFVLMFNNLLGRLEQPSNVQTSKQSQEKKCYLQWCSGAVVVHYLLAVVVDVKEPGGGDGGAGLG